MVGIGAGCPERDRYAHRPAAMGIGAMLVIVTLLGAEVGMSDDRPARDGEAASAVWLIDDFRDAARSVHGGTWRAVSDQVMGGVSQANMRRIKTDGRDALCLHGEVSLENNGGFVQINLDLATEGPWDARGYTGVWLIQRGNGEDYSVHLKTAATARPWQSYRAGFTSSADWSEVRLPFAQFVPHGMDQPLDPARLIRLGLVAIGRAMSAELCVAAIGFYRDAQGGAQ